MARALPPLVLLPPSETKATPRRGRPVDLAALSFPALTPQREALLDGPLRAAPTLPAGTLYTGVLYTALDLPSIPARARRRVVIVSAQFGAVRPDDRIPAYRREIDARHWRDALRAPLDEASAGRVILDCRSATYVSAWRPEPGADPVRVQVSVVEERDGKRRVVSHMAKKTRGEVARHVLLASTRRGRARRCRGAGVPVRARGADTRDRPVGPHGRAALTLDDIRAVA